MTDSARQKAIKEKRRAWRNQFIKNEWSKKKKKAEHDTKKEDKYDHDANMSTIGASSQFNDTLINLSYKWDSMVYKDKNFSEVNKTFRCLTLKELCARKIAENSTTLTFTLLKTGSWSQWILVWRQISMMNLDTFSIFSSFASAFHEEASFNCHMDVMSYPEHKKMKIMTSILPNSRNHRVERLFNNLNISSFIQSLNFKAFENVVILDISSSSISQDDLLHLTNLKNLTSLRISKVQPSDSTIHTWCTSIKSSKWQNLQVLSIPEVSQASLLKLQDVARYGKLMFIELITLDSSITKLNVRRDWKDMNYEDWELKNDDADVLNNMNWGMKTLAILRKYPIKDHSFYPKTLILDFTIMDQNFEGFGLFHENNLLWGGLAHKGRGSQSFLLNKKLQSKDVEKRPNTSFSSKKKKLKVNKPVSMKAFFDIK